MGQEERNVGRTDGGREKSDDAGNGESKAGAFKKVPSLKLKKSVGSISFGDGGGLHVRQEGFFARRK